jgi:tetratricopeptide (TPR) repeat protein
VYLHYFDDAHPAQHRRRLRAALGAFAAGLAGLPAAPSAVPTAALEVFTSNNLLWPRAPSAFVASEQLGPYVRHLVERPPALPLLAVRAARRAVAANPEDRLAWLHLGQAYEALRDLTCERSAEGRLPPLAQLRNVQIVNALAQAVRLGPDIEAAHHELALLYGQQNALDQSLVHLREELRLARRAGARPGETAEEAAHRLELVERDVVRLTEELDRRRQTFDSGRRSLHGQPVAEARAAVALGLARQAVDEILLPSPANLLGREGVHLELMLLVSLGEAEKVRSILNEVATGAGKDWLPAFDIPAPPGPGGAPLYPVPYRWQGYGWLRVLAAGALGDYAPARGALRDIRGGLRAGHEQLKQELQRLKVGSLAMVPSVLSGPPAYLPAAFCARVLGPMAEKRAVLEEGQRYLFTQQADLCVLEALLALEQGAPEEARLALAEAQRLCTPAGGPAFAFGGGPIAGAYLPLLNVKYRR